MKKCPYCGEVIHADAVTCNYCNSDLTTSDVNTPEQFDESGARLVVADDISEASKTHKWLKHRRMGVFMLILLGFGLAVTNPTSLDYERFKAEKTGIESNRLSRLLSNDDARNYMFFSIYASEAEDVNTDEVMVIKHLGIAGKFWSIGGNIFVNKNDYSQFEETLEPTQETEANDATEPENNSADIPLIDDGQK